MEKITFDNFDGENDFIEFNLNYEDKALYLTNVAGHISKIYKFKKPEKGTEKDKFIIKYSGNLKSKIEDRDIAYYIILKEKEGTKYLIKVDVFNESFINL